MIPFEFCRDFRRQKTRGPGLSCNVVCVILLVAVSVEHRLVTDRQTDGRTDTRRQVIAALASVARLKTVSSGIKLPVQEIDALAVVDLVTIETIAYVCDKIPFCIVTYILPLEY